jgi:hypothetical protein
MRLITTARMLRLALIGSAALALAPAAASAATLTDVVSGGGIAACDANAEVSQTFARWGDPSWYKAAPGGDFEAGSPAWKLSGGAKVVDGNAPQQVGGAGDDQSLQLAPGASATSPATCAGLAEPTIRMFSSGSALGAVLVQTVYNGIPLPLGAVTGGSWKPSLVALSGSGILGKTMQIRLTNVGIGTIKVDDVYIDPYRRG